MGDVKVKAKVVTNGQRQTAAVRYSKEAKCADPGARDTARDGTRVDRRKDETIEKKQRGTKKKSRGTRHLSTGVL